MRSQKVRKALNFRSFRAFTVDAKMYSRYMYEPPFFLAANNLYGKAQPT